ncbi:hypothetical protein LTR35_009366 [Friedmanniomyces endolithicus]|uniref:Transmembrane protein n=1 Tax=Friedmanniomyces endolithicus TaxID=329885 RepID=A0AAN6FCF4_9PEZI|nr:hypothetical protein LTS00_016424 [Friedmanniomyces endolithicus]KAK0278044.1 hypothetical protein LTR35_009366 [Friedmanniomyces endolithicus]KAK0314251.1 hypothetical protein LTR82_013176 [Friedmanniomyces endolithicus]KAK0997801.1 hypothetical protein LTR54_009598 [Friedmanniomyces endolithicus]
MATQQSSSPFPPSTPTSQSFLVTGQAKIWLGVAGAIVVVGLAISLWLVCTCARSKRRRQQSRALLDDRTSFPAWNPAAAHGASAFPEQEQGVVVMSAPEKAALRSTTEDAHPGEPVVVDEERNLPAFEARRGTRYYARQTARDSMWKRLSGRFSQIGRAY